ncbi:AT hook domain-containing protein [Colletotrichum paranaense]|uniref:AT hook domain-containing protein n=1 Tax=Colletotrichum paranaense TaxID=1914294 RepID=A0ABQ9SXZ6_9PEZI|nr:AT hook domain-containing protein [Colletotrichum paranaense]KAK1544377.1 AT hook domain-containing protein [Colletotrichum paranaense]
MAPARIIADSDDSDDDIESPNSPSKPTTTSAIPSQDRSSDPFSVATNSTDPKFFQAIYTEQQRAAVASDTLRKPDESSLSNGAAPSSIPAMPVADRPQLERNDTGTSSLTSASDLIAGLDSAEEREPEVVDLTEVTASPKMTVAHATPDDMWDVPSSPVGDGRAPLASLAKSRTSTSGTKRKRVNNVEFTSPVAIDMPSQGSTQPFDTTPAVARMENGKRARLRNPDSSLPAEEDDIDMVVVPHAAAVPSFGDLVSGQKPVSMYIESQTLSASQKLEYEYHSVGPSPEDPAPTPTQPFSTMQAAARSSGATTIAYSTPSQTRAIGLPPAHAESHVTLDTVQEQTQQGFGASVDPEATIEIQSSPDIISAASVRRKRRNVRDEPPQTTESHREDEGWDSDDIGFHRESYKPRVSRRRGSDSSRQDEAEMPGKIEIPVADMGPAAQLPLEEPAFLKEPASTSTTKPKKRGRPRKSDTAISESPAPAETSTMPQITDTSETVKDAAAGTVAATAATPTTTKKKRGRPKKADNNASESVQQATEKPHAPEVEHAGDAPSGKAAKHSKGRGEHVDAQQQEGCTADAGSGPREQGGSDRVLQPVTPNAALSKSGSDGLGPQKSAAAEGKGAATKETPAQADGDKSGTAGKAEGKQRLSTPAPLSATKPIYRVGLSKRSRIAPLLKSLKK